MKKKFSIALALVAMLAMVIMPSVAYAALVDVTFDLNGGEVGGSTTAQIRQRNIGDLVLPAGITPTKGGQTWTMWTFEKDNPATEVTNADTVAGPLTVYAYWQSSTVPNVPTKPVITTSPITAGSNVVVSGTSDANANVIVKVNGGSPQATTANGAGVWTVTFPSLVKDDSIVASVTGAGGTSVSDPVVVVAGATVPSAPAAPVITEPLTEGDLTVKGTCDAGSAVKVVTSTGTYDATVTGTSWTVAVPALVKGTGVSATATVTNAAGTSAPSPAATATVVAKPAEVVVDPPFIYPLFGGDNYLFGESEPNALITVSINGVVVGTVTADEDGFWIFPPGEDILEPALAAGDVVSATATVDGVVSEPYEVTVAKLLNVSLSVNKVVEGDKTVSGKSDPGAVVRVDFLDANGKIIGNVWAMADENGDWVATVADATDENDEPVSITLKAGDTIEVTAFSVDENDNPTGASNNGRPLTVTVQAKPAPKPEPLPVPNGSLPKAGDTTTSVVTLSTGALLLAGFALALRRRSAMLLGHE
ncbi:MAG: LPXTG cell wall anchor domain-containing protein [Actinomycetia bacterium]|nr:LPXTG cell wall anchor domain-containing protein [Actinomycetes bacterium]